MRFLLLACLLGLVLGASAGDSRTLTGTTRMDRALISDLIVDSVRGLYGYWDIAVDDGVVTIVTDSTLVLDGTDLSVVGTVVFDTTVTFSTPITITEVASAVTFDSLVDGDAGFRGLYFDASSGWGAFDTLYVNSYAEILFADCETLDAGAADIDTLSVFTELTCSGDVDLGGATDTLDVVCDGDTVTIIFTGGVVTSIN